MKTIYVNESPKLTTSSAEIIQKLKGNPELWLKRYMTVLEHIVPVLWTLVGVLGIAVVVSQAVKL